MRSARKIWRQNNQRINIVVSTSGRINEKVYDIPVTGLGPTRALGLLAPMLYTIYKTSGENSVLLSDHCDDKAKEGDLLLLGGPKNNVVTREALDRLAAKLPLTMRTNEDDEIFRTTATVGCRLIAPPPEVETEKQPENALDYGLIIQTTNCFDTSGTLTIIAGTHTYGTAAAARFFIENQSAIRALARTSYAMVVVARVTQGGFVERPELYMGPLEF